MTRSAWSLVLCAALAPSVASAGLVNRGLNAGVIAQIPIVLPAGVSSVAFDGIAPTADAVLHVSCGGVWVGSNDDYAGSVDPLVWVSRAAPSACFVVVHARADNTGGDGYLSVNGALTAYTAFGGFSVYQANGGLYRWETAQEPGGTDDAVLVGLDASGNLVQIDHDSGVGTDARLALNPSITRVVVGRTATSAPGTISLYGNDRGAGAGADTDGDGLGPQLEAALGTCNAAPLHSATFRCDDTDRDALPDDAEVFGVDGATPDRFPRWGATPTHKDVFYELDYKANAGAQVVQPSDLYMYRDLLAQATSAEVLNPDNTSGVRLHVDLGVNPTNPADATLYGNWGGSQRNVPNQNAMGVEYYADTARPVFMSSQRNATFRYILAGTGTGGNAWGNIMNIGLSQTLGPVIAHEGGHTLLINHWGHDSWGATNCKPQYKSIMNYVYSYAAGYGFSRDLPGLPVNPSMANEATGLGYTNAGLSGEPYRLTAFGATGWDFNRDGFLSSVYAVRAPVSWAMDTGCHSLDRKKLPVASGNFQSTADIVRVGSRLYAFWADPAGTVKFRSGVVTGPDANGSCPLGDTLDDNPCMTWNAETTIAGMTGVDSLSIATDGAQIILSTRTTTGSVQVRTSTSVSAAGAITWGASTTIAVNATTFEPESAYIRVSPAVFGTSNVRAVLYRDTATSQIRWSWFNGATWTAPAAVLSETGGTVLAGSSPTVAATAAGESCMAHARTNGTISVRCYDTAAQRWRDQPNLFAPIPAAAPVMTNRKIGMAWHVNREFDGVPVEYDALNGEFYLYVAATSGTIFTLLGSHYNQGAPVGTSMQLVASGVPMNWGSIGLGTSGVNLYEDAGLGALKGIFSIDNGAWGGKRHELLPLADGTFDGQLTTGNDYFVMERGVCRGLRDDAWCGLPANTVHGL